MSKTHRVEIRHQCTKAVCAEQIAFSPGDIVIFHYDDACVRYIAVPSGDRHSCDGCDLLDTSPSTNGNRLRCKIRDIRDNCLCLIMSNGVLRHMDKALENVLEEI